MSYNRIPEQFAVPVTVPQAPNFLIQTYPNIQPINYTDIYFSAHKLFDEHRYPECINMANILINTGIDSLKSHGYLILGACYFNLNEYEQSAAFSKLAIDVNPNLAGAYYNLANALKSMNRLEEAKNYLHQSILICPSFIGAHLLYANILARLGQLEDACRAYQNVISLCPNMLIAYYNLSILQLGLHKTIECSRTYLKIAEILKSNNETEKALSYYREACKLEQTNWECFFHYGIALKESGKLTDAFQMLTSALHLNGSSATIYYNLATIYESLGNDSRALENYQKAIFYDMYHIDRYFLNAKIMKK